MSRLIIIFVHAPSSYRIFHLILFPLSRSQILLSKCNETLSADFECSCLCIQCYFPIHLIPVDTITITFVYQHNLQHVFYLSPSLSPFHFFGLFIWIRCWLSVVWDVWMSVGLLYLQCLFWHSPCSKDQCSVKCTHCTYQCTVHSHYESATKQHKVK